MADAKTGNAPASPHDYTLTIDLNALNHLGINLYSNIPAVISETVANAWDADAEHVWIDVDKARRILTITDDGRGMNEYEINNRYLRVGYKKRDIEGTITPRFKRHVMGRKGIGKLSLFSIAHTIEVHSVRADDNNIIERNALRMNSEAIKKVIEGGKDTYKPLALDEALADMNRGTRIMISNLKSDAALQTAWTRKRLARRFSIIGDEHKFEVILDGKPITIEDRDYFNNLQYIWYIGEGSERYANAAVNASKREYLDGVIDINKNFTVSGWIGTFDEQRNIDNENNSIVILAWGKLVQEDLLPDIDEAGLFTKYLIGEIRADFVDFDDQEDIATSDRQRLQKDDDRYKQLKAYIQDVIKSTIKLRWSEWRKEGSKERALKNEVVREWYEQLPRDSKKYAHDVFERLERLEVPNEGLRRELYKQSILAFEAFAHRQNLSELATLQTADDFERFVSIFGTMDQLEEAHYYSIAKSRLEALAKLEGITPKTKERTIQELIFDHLWLLDPSWERASTDAVMEKKVTAAWQKLDAKLNPAEAKARLDIRYRTAARKHIVIELKRYGIKPGIHKLLEQVQKYQSALRKVLAVTHPNEHHIVETICVLGNRPEPSDADDENRRLLSAVNGRYILYDELILQTRDSYRDYILANEKIGRIRELVAKLSP